MANGVKNREKKNAIERCRQPTVKPVDHLVTPVYRCGSNATPLYPMRSYSMASVEPSQPQNVNRKSTSNCNVRHVGTTQRLLFY